MKKIIVLKKPGQGKISPIMNFMQKKRKKKIRKIKNLYLLQNMLRKNPVDGNRERNYNLSMRRGNFIELEEVVDDINGSSTRKIMINTDKIQSVWPDGNGNTRVDVDRDHYRKKMSITVKDQYEDLKEIIL